MPRGSAPTPGGPCGPTRPERPRARWALAAALSTLLPGAAIGAGHPFVRADPPATRAAAPAGHAGGDAARTAASTEQGDSAARSIAPAGRGSAAAQLVAPAGHAGAAVRATVSPEHGNAPVRLVGLAGHAEPAAPAAASPAHGSSAAASRPGEQAPAAVTSARTDGVLLHFPPGTGAALVRRGGVVLAVFDNPSLRNPEALRHPAVADALEARALPGGFVLAFPADRARPVGLSRGPAGWVLGAATRHDPAPGSPALHASPAAIAGPAPGVAFDGVPPNRVVLVRDPETGLPLLVGTTRDAVRGSAGGRRAPEYDLLETGVGVAVLARSGGLELKILDSRFVLSGSALSPLSLDAAALGPAAGAAMTRCLGLPDLRTERLLARLRSQSADLAATEPLARATRRRDLAATMLALGLGHEAQAEMARAAVEASDAAAGNSGRFLAAAAALVAGRSGEAAAAFRPEPAPGCDELVLWRSLFLAGAGGDLQVALPGLRATLPLLLAYPEGLRDRLLPLAAGALAESGAWPDLRALLAAAPPGASWPALPAAMLLEADGNEDGALSAYDEAARGRDRRARAAALRRAVELRLRTGRMDAAAAARAYAPATVAWRGDASERDARTRLAQLLALSGDARGALALLRHSVALFPDGAAAARREAALILRAALDGGAAGAGGSALGAVAAFQAGADLLPPEERGEAEARLAELLAELDLPARAASLLEAAAGRVPAGDARAEAGWRLAALRFREDDAAGARAALDATDAPEMADALRERRAALAAAAADRGGPDAAAEAALARRDWAAAARVLGKQLDGRLPAAPAPLDPGAREAALRLAAALALAGDDAAFAALAARVGGRMGEGPHAVAFAKLVGAGARPPEPPAGSGGVAGEAPTAAR